MWEGLQAQVTPPSAPAGPLLKDTGVQVESSAPPASHSGPRMQQNHLSAKKVGKLLLFLLASTCLAKHVSGGPGEKPLQSEKQTREEFLFLISSSAPRAHAEDGLNQKEPTCCPRILSVELPHGHVIVTVRRLVAEHHLLILGSLAGV